MYTYSRTAGTTLPPKVALDAALVATNINTTWAKVGWRRLNETELLYIDGIQLRYRDVDVDAQVGRMDGCGDGSAVWL